MQEIAAEMRKRRAEIVKIWWDNLSDEKRDEYEEIRIIGSDEEFSKELHLWKCRRLLMLSDKLVNKKGVSACVVKGVAIHGVVPVILVQMEGMETPRHENMNHVEEFSKEVDPHLEQTKYEASFDTAPFGIPAKQKPLGVWAMGIREDVLV